MGSKRPPTTCEQIIRRRDDLFDALSKESSRGVVLVSASFLEEALESLLRARFSIRHPKSKSSIDPLFKTFGPLSSFSAKIRISYAMDLIGEWVYRDLQIVREVRNRFAHSVELAQFDSPEVAHLTEKLKAADIAVTTITKGESRAQDTKKIETTNSSRSNRSKSDMERARFEMSVCFIGALLHVLARTLSIDEPLKVKEDFIERIRSAK